MVSKVIVIAGTAATGKSSIAKVLTTKLQESDEKYSKIEFIEGDSLHPPSNVEKMSHGIPLNDEDRWDWLKEVSKLSSESSIKNGGICIITCSSLKLKYRDLIRETCNETKFYFIFLYGDKDVIKQRMIGRKGHFMKVNMIDSQFNDLELPKPEEENCTIVDVDGKSYNEIDDEVWEVIENDL